MSLYGVKIGEDNDWAWSVASFDTLEWWGLFLLEEGFVVGTPTIKENNIDVPGRDGALDASNMPQGYPVYNDRQIAFRLFKDVGMTAMEELRQELMRRCHGRRMRVQLPTDEEHYYLGRVHIGDMQEERVIPVTVTAYPYKLKHAESTLALDGLSTEAKTYTVSTEARYVVPRITVTRPTVIQMFQGPDGIPAAVTLRPDVPGEATDFYAPETLLLPGTNQFTARLVAAASDAYAMMSWREGAL